MNKKVVIIGPAWPLRGGLASFDERLARQFIAEGYETIIYTFSLQYPGFLFPGTTQYSDEPAPAGLDIRVRINSVNPINWLMVGREIKKLKPDLVVVRYWLPLLGPCLGTVLRIIRKNRVTKMVCLVDNVVPHEKRPGDTLFTRYFVKPLDAFVTMSEKVTKDLLPFTSKPVKLVVHPLLDGYGPIVSKKEAREKLGLPADEKIILFFGLIRRYKGLDILLHAMNEPAVRESGIKLLVAGEYYENKKEYDTLIEKLGIGGQLILRTNFVPNSELRYYFCAADFLIQPYRNATQSGVTPVAYHFEKPMLVTNMGGLPDFVPDRKVGIVTEPEPKSIAAGIVELYKLGENFFLPHLRGEKEKYSWQQLTGNIISLAAL
jgi:glycosyltransferase involved in cell wall biosynthesis